MTQGEVDWSATPLETFFKTNVVSRPQSQPAYFELYPEMGQLLLSGITPKITPHNTHARMIPKKVQAKSKLQEFSERDRVSWR